MALDLDSENHIISLSYDLLELGQSKQALTNLLPHADSAAASPRLLWHTAHMARLNEQTPSAIELLKRAIKLAPQVTQLYLDLSTDFVTQRDIPKAIQILQEGYKATSNYAPKAKEVLLRLKEQDDIESARLYMSDTAETAPEAIPSVLHALVSIVDEDWPAALEHCQNFMNLSACEKTANTAPLPTTDIPANKPHHSITAATSLSPKGGQQQIDAMKSWENAVDQIISVNTPEEIAILQPDFPKVDFVIATSTKTSPIGKPLIFIDDILVALEDCETDLRAIINGDILLLSENALQEEVSKLGPHGLTFFHRTDLLDKTSTSGTLYRDGLDAFVFAPHFIPMLKGSSMQLGSPWWDYLFPVLALQNGIPMHIPRASVIGHVLHPTNWSITSFYNALIAWIADIQSKEQKKPSLHAATDPAYTHIVRPLLKALIEEFRKVQVAPDSLTKLTPHMMNQTYRLTEEENQGDNTTQAPENLTRANQLLLIISFLLACRTTFSPLQVK